MRFSNFIYVVFLTIQLISQNLSFASQQKIKEEEEDYNSRRNTPTVEQPLPYFGTTPVGGIIAFAGEKAPQGWLLCDGGKYSDRKYPYLYNVLKTKYVTEEWIFKANEHGSENFFQVPDLKGRGIIGVDGGMDRVSSDNRLGDNGGEEKVTLTTPQIPSHTHTSGEEIVHIGNKEGDKLLGFGMGHGIYLYNGTHQLTTTSSGGDQPHNNMAPYLVLNYIIYTGQRGNDPDINYLE